MAEIVAGRLDLCRPIRFVAAGGVSEVVVIFMPPK